jgi:DivIVA domain-containing protein
VESLQNGNPKDKLWSSSERDSDPPRESPEVTAPRFTISRRGYDTAEVDRFVRLIGERLRVLEAELERQRTRTSLLERRGASAQEAAYARIFQHLTDVVRAADEAAESIRLEADADAMRVRAEARSAADAIRSETLSKARVEAEGIVAAAWREADRLARERALRPGAAFEAAEAVRAERYGEAARSSVRQPARQAASAGSVRTEPEPEDLDVRLEIPSLDLFDERDATT